MTKAIRIENADTSNHKVVVELWDKGADGQPDTLAGQFPLNNPTDLTTQHVWDTRYLVIREVT